MAAAAVHTHQQSRVESHESCRVKSLDATCSIFVSQTLAIGRGDCCLAENMDIEKLILLVKDHEAIFDASRCDHRNRDYISSVWQKIAQQMGEGNTSALMFYFLI
jgi:ribulose kinase